MFAMEAYKPNNAAKPQPNDRRKDVTAETRERQRTEAKTESEKEAGLAPSVMERGGLR
jgi:hypothetical protein